MAEKSVLICDGCEKVTSKRRPVEAMILHLVDDGGEPVDEVFTADAHDANCFRRSISRDLKKIREAKAAEKTNATKAPPKK